MVPHLYTWTFQNNVNGGMFALYGGGIPCSIPLIFQIPFYSRFLSAMLLFISQFDINDFFLRMFSVLISVCTLLHLALVTMHRMCLAFLSWV